MLNAVDELSHPISQVDQEWYRLIPSRFPPIDVYERLGSDALKKTAQELESITNPRLAAKARLVAGPSGVDANSPKLQNWNHAPFSYKNPKGSRFLDKAYGVMEVAADLAVALGYAVNRRELFLMRTSEAPTALDMRVLITRIRGKFVDLTGLPLDMPQAERWTLGKELYDKGASGVLFHRPGFGKAQFLAAFTTSVLSATVQGTHYRFVWDGKEIRSVYDFTAGRETLRADLQLGDSGKEAA